MKRILKILKVLFDLVFFSFLGGSAIAIFSGVIAEFIYPPLVHKYWPFWWAGWWIGFAVWMLIIKKKEKGSVFNDA